MYRHYFGLFYTLASVLYYLLVAVWNLTIQILHGHIANKTSQDPLVLPGGSRQDRGSTYVILLNKNKSITTCTLEL